MPTTAIAQRPAWEQEANCFGLDPDLFFPDRGASPEAAKAVCAGCQVRDDCLAMALRERINYGVWGGLTSSERLRLVRRRRLRP
jgi:WhiB family redox-sensing transcriptional regulator